MATAWRLARALDVYKAELNTRWPARDRRSDGGIGDAEHATRSSDHNPWLKSSGLGVVRAWDTDKDLTGAGTDALPPQVNVEANWLAEHLRALGKAGDPRLIGGGYVIWNCRIAGEVGDWAWRPYDGENAHKHHVHLSVSRNATGFDSTAPWGITQEDDLDANQAKMLQEIHDELFKRLPNRVGPNASQEGTGADTILGYAANADGYGTRIERYLHSDEFADRIATRLLSATVEPALTMKDGNVTSQKISVTQALTRAQEASIVRQRGEIK